MESESESDDESLTGKIYRRKFTEESSDEEEEDVVEYGDDPPPLVPRGWELHVPKRTKHVASVRTSSVASLPSFSAEKSKEQTFIEKDPNLKVMTGLPGMVGECWKCLKCKKVFSGSNSSKAMFHLARMSGQSIAKCSAPMTKEQRSTYDNLYNEFMAKRASKVKAHSVMNESIDRNTQLGAASLSNARASKKTKGNFGDVYVSQSEIASLSNESVSGQKRQYQTLLNTNARNLDMERHLELLIADLIHSNNLPFSLAQDPKFRAMLRLAKGVSTKYKPPLRNQVAGELLDHNYQMSIERADKTLLKQADIFGLTVMGDGATVKKTPLLNILAAGVDGSNNACCTLEIVDATGHMSSGGKKDAEYIAKLFLPHMKRLDPDRRLIDLIFFDGASNVQKAGRILETHYPRASTMAGGEHITSLFFNDVSKIKKIKLIIGLYRHIYKWFGSGTHHQVHAVFRKQSMLFNNGRFVGLIRASDIRMAGHIIALLRLLRMKEVIDATMATPELIRNKEFPKALKSILKSGPFWNFIFAVCRTLYPAMRLLRLCDMKQPGMDKLHYFVRKTNSMFIETAGLVDTAVRACNVYVFPLIVMHFSRDPNENAIPAAAAVVLAPLDLSDDDSDDGDDDDEGAVPGAYQVEPNLNFLTDAIVSCWMKRMMQLISPYSITGWMCSAIKEIRDDAAEFHSSADKKKVSSLVLKLMLEPGDTAAETKTKGDEILNVFWDEYSDFLHKTGEYGDRDYIWNSVDLINGDSHLWHLKNSLHTKYFGKIACIVCSKLLGIGNAERNWGTLKAGKDGQRSHVSASAIMKQTTICGAYYAEKACVRQNKFRSLQYHGEEDGYTGLWDEKDAAVCHLNKYGVDIRKVTGKRIGVRTIRAFVEPWEGECILSKDPVLVNKLLCKYGGIVWYDPDTDKLFTACDEDVQWSASKKKEDRGNSIIGLLEIFNRTAKAGTEEADAWEPWVIGEALFECIINHYRKNPDPYVKVITLEMEAAAQAEKDRVEAEVGAEEDAETIEKDVANSSFEEDEEPHPPTDDDATVGA